MQSLRILVLHLQNEFNLHNFCFAVNLAFTLLTNFICSKTYKFKPFKTSCEVTLLRSCYEIKDNKQRQNLRAIDPHVAQNFIFIVLSRKTIKTTKFLNYAPHPTRCVSIQCRVKYCDDMPSAQQRL